MKNSEYWRNLAEHHNNRLYYTVGIHPLYVDQDWSASLDMLKSFWSLSKKPCALGEVGLDYFRLPSETDNANKIVALLATTTIDAGVPRQVAPRCVGCCKKKHCMLPCLQLGIQNVCCEIY